MRHIILTTLTASLIAMAACSLGDADPRCTFAGPPTVVKEDGAAILQVWTVTESDVRTPTELPEDARLSEYRGVIEGAGADLRRPIADRPEPTNESERELWRREDQNVEVAYSGRAGVIRPIRCLDGLLFTYQHARYSQLSHPTEFIASIVRKRVDGEPVLKVYFGAGDTMFPPKGFYGFDQVEQDVAAGWEFLAVLHNHTIQQNDGAPALGVPAPSTSDVDLLRSLASEMGLQSAWVTNGFFTIEIPASAFEQYLGRANP